jgi:ribosomal protein L20A (L18A)
MTNKPFAVEGDFQMGRVRQKFRIEVVCSDVKSAHERAYTELGSRHGAKRREVKITGVTPLSVDDASTMTQHRMKA